MARLRSCYVSGFYSIACAVAWAVVSSMVTVSARAETLTVLHAFAGPDGAFPYAGLTIDQAGNYYGTTSVGGNNGCQSGLGCGTIFELSHSAGSWQLTTLYVFQGGSDGAQPYARVLFGADGSLYGTTEYGGLPNSTNANGYGTVFKLTPPNPSCEGGPAGCPWKHTVLYRFTGGGDGANPGPGDLAFDSAGNIYGTTQAGGLINSNCLLGNQGCGVVFKLTPSGSAWTESVVYSFTGGDDGDLPLAGVTFGANGSLYGTASEGGAVGYGTVFQLNSSGSIWMEVTLHSFTGYDGAYPSDALVFDGSGNLWGDTSFVINSGGSVFELTQSGGRWTVTFLYILNSPNDPSATLTLSAGNVYGSTPNGGSNGFGSVFEFIPNSGGWTFETLYSFGTKGQNPALEPQGNVLLDGSGDVFGTASQGAAYSDGAVYELTP